jgi:ankyrin repeat protein
VKSIREYEGWQASDFFSDTTSLRICEAISSRDPVELKRLIEGNVDLNVRGNGGFTLLHWALAEESFDAFKTLLARGADPDLVLDRMILGKYFVFPKDESVILSSMRCRRGEFCVATLPYSKNVNQKRGGNNLLHVFFQADSVMKDVLRDLIAAGIDVNAVGKNGYTPCHHAAYKRPEFCIPLLEAGADATIRDDAGRDIPAALEFTRARLLQANKDVAEYDEVIAWLKARSGDDSAQP